MIRKVKVKAREFRIRATKPASQRYVKTSLSTMTRGVYTLDKGVDGKCRQVTVEMARALLASQFKASL